MTLHRATCPRCGNMSHADKRGKMMCCAAREYDEEKPVKIKIYKRKRTRSARVLSLEPTATTHEGPDPDTQMKLFT